MLVARIRCDQEFIGKECNHIDVLIGGDREWADGNAAVEMGNKLKL
jgi:hypothetical protein